MDFSSWILISMVLLCNVIIPYFFQGSSDHYINPKFIASSYDSDETIEFDSLILKSLSQYLTYFFPSPNIITKHVGDLPLGRKKEETVIDDISMMNYTSNITENRTNSKYEMILKNDSVLIFKFHIDYIPSVVSDISLYQIPKDNFMIKTKNKFDIRKSFIRLKWKSSFNGKIISYKISANKQNIVVYYSITHNNVITYRFRYFHLDKDITQESISQNDLSFNDEYLTYVNSTSQEQFTYDMITETYDDIHIDGNLPINSFDSDDGLIIFAYKNSDQFHILRKNDTEWTLSAIKAIYYDNVFYNYVNSIKIINSDKVFFTYISITNKGILANGDSIILSTKEKKTILSYRLDNGSTDDKETTYIFNVEYAKEKLKKFFREGIFSNNINDRDEIDVIFEYFFGSLVKVKGTEIIVIDDKDSKVDSVSSDKENLNIVVKYENGELMYYKINDGETEEMKISFNGIPKKYKKNNNVALTYMIENIDNRIIMIVLFDNGVMLSLDFSDGKSIGFIRSIIGSFLCDNFLFLLQLGMGIVTVFKKFQARRRNTNNVIDHQNNTVNYNAQQQQNAPNNEQPVNNPNPNNDNNPQAETEANQNQQPSSNETTNINQQGNNTTVENVINNIEEAQPLINNNEALSEEHPHME